MKKNELIELLKEIGDDQEINETILGIEDFAKSSEFDVNKLTLEDFKKVITDNKEIKGYYTSEKDRVVSKGIETFKTNNLQKLIDEAVKAKSEEGLTEEQKQIRGLIAYKEQKEKEEKINEIKKGYKDIFTEKKLSADLMDFINFDGEKENINSAIEKLSKVFGDSVNAGVKERIGDKDETPPKDDNNNLTMEQQIAQAMGIK